MKPKPEQDGARVGLDRVAAQGLEALVKPAVLLEEPFLLGALIGGLEVLRQDRKAVLEGGDVLGRGQCLREHRQTVHLDRFLLEVAHDRVARERDPPAVGVLTSRDDVEQGGLARTVRSDERDAIARANAQTRVLEQDARTEGLRDVVDRENHENAVYHPSDAGLR